jgi:hypothetical protein
MKIDNREVFEQLGNLFYAIASEQHVKPLEVGELKMLISKDWLPRNLESNKSVVSDETHFILMTMDTLQASKTSAKDAFRQFAKFYKFYPEIFSPVLKRRILGTAAAINKIFKADNPADNASLVGLEGLFNGIKATI